MNKKQLIRLGVPADCVATAIQCIQRAADCKARSLHPKKLIPRLIEAPQAYLNHDLFGDLARAVIALEQEVASERTIAFQQWGDNFDQGSLDQMKTACRLPVAAEAALMPDAHVGYGLPIGGVLACENAIIPYAVGVDIACRMKLTVTDISPELTRENRSDKCAFMDRALQRGTRFGTGKGYQQPFDHQVMDEDWTITAITRTNKDKAWSQLGTSGSGNHFVEWGELEIFVDDLDVRRGRYTALMSHSGSRGAGAAVCQRYSQIARKSVPQRIRDDKRLRHLAWLSMDSESGQEYWQAMNLMGRYASANHEIIHRQVLCLAGAQALGSVENHHNFAWLEEHHGKQLYVHRKGATPAGAGELGVIPGSMADSAFLVRGKGHPGSLHSASHGAGRVMSRTAAKKQFHWADWRRHLADKNVRLLAGGLDEVPGAYKNIHQVMAAQTDLVEVVGEFFPRIVMMCGDGSRPED